MHIKSRKIFIWILSLAIVFVLFLIYKKFNISPIIITQRPPELLHDVCDLSKRKGKVGTVEIGSVQKAEYISRNAKTKEIEGVFGFEKLLNQAENEWEIEKPYRIIYKPNFVCRVTADKGSVSIDPAARTPSPKDAALIGNVVISIAPQKDKYTGEYFIYLDDITFVSEKSLFTTAGPVKLVSPDIQLNGKGLEAVYNEGTERIEYLKLISLESLRIKNKNKTELFPSAKRESVSPPAAESVTSNDTNQSPGLPAAPETYKCVLLDNVRVSTPEHLITADELSISDIILKSLKNNTVQPEANEPNQPSPQLAVTLDVNAVPASVQSEPNKTESPFSEIVVTCDKGLIFMPVNSPLKLETYDPNIKTTKNIADANGRITFVAQKIDYGIISENVLASGRSELSFFAKDKTAADTNIAPVPVKISASQKITYTSAANQAIFEGDCAGTMLKKEQGADQKYTLTSPRFVVNLTKNKASSADIGSVTADGGRAYLTVVKMAGDKMLGFTKLKCTKIDFDNNQQIVLAMGPGLIAADNSKIAEPGNKKPMKFGLQKQCYALLNGFETLTYSLKTNRIVTDAISQKTSDASTLLNISYVPIVGGKDGEATKVTAKHIDISLAKTVGGQDEISALAATGGITFEDENRQFIGNDLFYDANTSDVYVTGDEHNPCFLNGTLVDRIDWNIRTNRIKTNVIGPSQFQMKK